MRDSDAETPGLFPDLSGAPDPWDKEKALWEKGYRLVAGVDEAGRGPLAGPVVAAAVILDQGSDYPGVGDSKQISAPDRETAFWMIMGRARAVGLGWTLQDGIDDTNILQASLTAMRQAVMALRPAPDYILVDGTFPVPMDLPQRPLPHGDGLSISIGAASIVAKVFRDRLMAAYDRHYPAYGFAVHKGYGTAAHLDALDRHGPCRLHRQSFNRVKG